MNCLCDRAIDGLGQTSDISFGIDEVASDIGAGSVPDVTSSAVGEGFFGSIGEFFGSNFGSSLLKGGLTIGSAYAISQLGGGRSASGGTVLPGQVGSGQPPAGAIPGQAPATPGQTPAWVLSVALAGGAALLVALLMRRR